MLRSALSVFGPTHAAHASYNNHWGVPLTLARTPPDAAFAVIEIGMNAPGEILPLARLARPHVAVITAIAAAHIGHLGSLDAIADEKATLLQGLEPGGTAVLPINSDRFGRLLGNTQMSKAIGTSSPGLTRGPRASVNAETPRHEIAGSSPGMTNEGEERAILTFGSNPAATICLLSHPPVHAIVQGAELTFHLQAPGAHMASNALAALGAVAALGLDPARAAHALESFTPGPGRGQQRRIVGNQVLLLDESYNASSASVRAALAVLATLPATRRLAVLGDMLELGAFGESEHAGLAPDVANAADLLYACGPLTRSLFDRVPPRLRAAHTDTSEALAPIVAAAIRPGDAVLVKGSLGSRMRVVVRALEAASFEGPG